MWCDPAWEVAEELLPLLKDEARSAGEFDSVGWDSDGAVVMGSVRPGDVMGAGSGCETGCGSEWTGSGWGAGVTCGGGAGRAACDELVCAETTPAESSATANAVLSERGRSKREVRSIEVQAFQRRGVTVS